MSRIKVLEAITPSRIGGAEIYVTELCTKLPKCIAPTPICYSERSKESQTDSSQTWKDILDVRVELFCPAGRPFVEYARKRGIEPITWKTHGKIDPLTLIRLARLMRTHEIDVIHTHLSTASLLGALAAKLSKKPSVAHVHGLNTATCFRYSTRIIAVSNAVKHHLTAQKIAEDRIRVVHNGVDLDTFQPEDVVTAKLRLGYDPEAPLFGVFGRLAPEKGQLIAIGAMPLVLKELSSARLVLAGQGRDWDELQAYAKALGVEEHVQFAGFVHNVRHLMSACDVVVVPSARGEGFGLAAIEAMALERPVVATSTGGLPEIVVPGETGILVPPNDAQALAYALIDLVSRPSLQTQLGKNGRRRVEERFNLKKQLALTLEVLVEVV